MKHDAAVEYGIRGSCFHPLANKAVFECQMIIGVGCIIIKMAKLVVEITILIVTDFNNAVFYPEGSGECPNCGRIC